MCCRLAAQPHCMNQQMMSGCLKVKVSTRRLSTFPSLPACLSLSFFSPLRCTEGHRLPLSSSPQQLGADPHSWTEVFAVLKGTSLFCYHRQEDVEANVEPAFTIAVNKVSEGSVRGGLRVAGEAESV